MLGRWVWLVLALAVASCERTAAPPGEAAREFFERIRTGAVREAYEGAAFNFRVQQSLRQFQVAVQEVGLMDAAAFTFDAPQLDGDTARLSVRVARHEGSLLTLRVTLIEDGGTWRIFALEPASKLATALPGNPFSFARPARNFDSGFDRDLPTDDDVRQLVAESLSEFAAAIRTKKYAALYDHISLWWREQVPENRLKRDLLPWNERPVQFGEIAPSDVVFESKPRFNLRGELIIAGYVPQTDGRATFKLSYVYEVPKWWLSGILVGFEESAAAGKPQG